MESLGRLTDRCRMVNWCRGAMFSAAKDVCLTRNAFKNTMMICSILISGPPLAC